jgi:hypothetical protein
MSSVCNAGVGVKGSPKAIVALAVAAASLMGACSSTEQNSSGNRRSFCKSARTAEILDPLDMESFQRPAVTFRALAREAPASLDGDIRIIRKFIDGAAKHDNFTDSVAYLQKRVEVATRHLAKVAQTKCHLDIYSLDT